MVKKADKLLERMRRSKSGWKRVDIDSVYEAHGFKITGKTGGHDKVYHPDYPQLITYLPRHKNVGEAYIEQLIKKIDQLERLKSLSKEIDTPEEDQNDDK